MTTTEQLTAILNNLQNVLKLIQNDPTPVILDQYLNPSEPPKPNVSIGVRGTF